MRLRKGYLYSALGATFAIAFGLAVGPYWIDDALVLGLLAFAVIVACLGQSQEMKALVSWWSPGPRQSQPASSPGSPAEDSRYGRYTPRSKIAHFVLLSRIRFTTLA